MCSKTPCRGQNFVLKEMNLGIEKLRNEELIICTYHLYIKLTLWDFTFLQWGVWCITALWDVVLLKQTDISRQQRQYTSLKRQSTSTGLHGNVAHKPVIFNTSVAYVATNVAILHSSDDLWVWRALAEWCDRRKLKNMLLCSPQIPHGLTWVRTHTSMAKGHWLTTWAIAWPFLIAYWCHHVYQTQLQRTLNNSKTKPFSTICVCNWRWLKGANSQGNMLGNMPTCPLPTWDTNNHISKTPSTVCSMVQTHKLE
jgi:hypothetical protein